MKETPQIYADKVIQQHYFVPNHDDYYAMSKHMAIQCAIIDVKNTIEVLNYAWTNFDNNSMDELLQYYNEVLTILKDKL